MSFYPVNLNIKDRHCVVIGGGQVAARKLRALIECEAKITVVSPEVCSEVQEMEDRGDILIHQREFQPGDLTGAMVCIAATDNRTVQNMVRDEARKENCLLNSIDDQTACDFQVPSKVRRGDLLLTVSTGGASPTLSKDIRIRLEEEFGPEYGRFIRFLGIVREQLLAVKSAKDDFSSVFHALVQDQYLSLITDQDWIELERNLVLDLPKAVSAVNIVKKIKGEIIV